MDPAQTQTGGFFRKSRAGFGIVFGSLVLYSLLLVWVWRHPGEIAAFFRTAGAIRMKQNQAESKQQKPLPRSFATVAEKRDGEKLGFSNVPILTPTENPFATPTPAMGTGVYACDQAGACSNYGENVKAFGCPKTYADFRCLDECRDPAVRCSAN